jgi:peptidoglycan/LPS O-acetylase OafA/YrhL
MALQDWLTINSNKLTSGGSIILIVACIIYLTILSFLVKDLNFPVSHPIIFTIETIVCSFGIGLLTFLMAYNRNNLNNTTPIAFLIVSLKFGIIHILLQFSGFYSYIYSA